MRVTRLHPDDVALVAAIDRTEQVNHGYEVVDGELRQIPSPFDRVDPWDPVGTGSHSIATEIEFCRSALERGGVLFGAFDDDTVAGLAIVVPTFEPQLAWLAFLHVTRPYRRRRVAQALWDACVEACHDSGAEKLYVSATPTDSAIGFYVRQGCRPADAVHPELFAAEPDDIHLVHDLQHHQQHP